MSRNLIIGEPLDERQKQVLFATIAKYVETGRPVSSKALSTGLLKELSPASIRRTLQDLTLIGLLVQPHVSAGRTPTDSAFRMFVDALREPSVSVNTDDRDALWGSIRGLIPSETGSWREMVRLLSDLSTQAALVITPAVSDSILRQLKFIPIEGSRLLAVVVTREGLVHNAYLKCDKPVERGELERIHNYLEEVTAGHTLNEVRHVLRDEMVDAKKRCDDLRHRAATLGSAALESSRDSVSQLLVEGRSKLIEQPELEGSLRELMSRLEEKARILTLLDQAAESDRGPLVIIGSEGGEEFTGCALIAAPFGKDGFLGNIGIVGSTRMNYPAIIPLVTLSAQLLSDSLKREEED